MISREYWEFHLTKDGWVEGSYKTDTQGRVEKPTPDGSLMLRNYYSDMDSSLRIHSGYEDYDKLPEADEYLEIFPAPKGYEGMKSHRTEE